MHYTFRIHLSTSRSPVEFVVVDVCWLERVVVKRKWMVTSYQLPAASTNSSLPRKHIRTCAYLILRTNIAVKVRTSDVHQTYIIFFVDNTTLLATCKANNNLPKIIDNMQLEVKKLLEKKKLSLNNWKIKVILVSQPLENMYEGHNLQNVIIRIYNNNQKYI